MAVPVPMRNVGQLPTVARPSNPLPATLNGAGACAEWSALRVKSRCVM